jgi:hypothetical protein
MKVTTMRRGYSWNQLYGRLIALAVGGCLFVGTGPLAGCKQSVQTAFYTGLENLAVALVQAFFAAITPTSGSGSTTAQFLGDTLSRWLT